MRWIENIRIGKKFAILIGFLVVGLAVAGVSTSRISTSALMNGRVQSLRSIVDMAVSTANGLEKKVQSGQLSKAAAITLFQERLSNMSFDNGNGYYFVFTADGSTIFMPDPKLIGTNRYELTLTNGAKPIKDQLDGVRQSKKGFEYRLVYPKPGETADSLKINYTVWYEPWGIMIGTGVYVDDVYEQIAALNWSMFEVFGVTLLILIGLATLLAFNITRPLLRLNGVMLRVANGDLEAESGLTARKDEVGTLARALDVFKEYGLRARAQEAEASEARVTVERERERAEADRAAIAKQQAQVVTNLAAGLAGLAAGDLTGQMQDFPEQYRKLEDDFNAAIKTLQDMIRTIASNGHSIRSGTGEISKAADDLSRRTEHQAANLEETAAALDEITATVRKTADGAKHARTVVSGTHANAESSGKVVQDAIQAMGEIETSANEISQIIGVIDEIAFQTNLLALNAGVEAARAGDAGRGFAVVASEVRALAQRSAQAAKEIKALIGTSTSHVSRGVTLVRETGTALGRILVQVTEITEIVSEIAASAQEQATGLHQVNTAVNQMDQMTQQNAAMVEQSTAASHAIAGEAEQLVTLLGRFHTGHEDTNPPALTSLAAKRRPRSASRPAVHGNLALIE